MDPLQWMGAVRMRVQTADKNITSNPHHSSPSINVLLREKLCVCREKIHHEDVFNFKLLIPAKISSILLSSIHNVAFSSEKVILSESGEICTYQALFTSENSPKHICVWILIWKDNRTWTFHWRKCYYGLWTCIFARSEGLKLHALKIDLFWTCSFSLHKTLTDRLKRCGLLWCFYQLFGLSFWRHPFTAEDPLVSKWCNAAFLQICSDEETNSSTSWMAWGWVHFHFWMDYSCEGHTGLFLFPCSSRIWRISWIASWLRAFPSMLKE